MDDFVALIVEPRKHKALQFVITNVSKSLPGHTILLYHGTKNKKFAQKASQGLPVKLVSLGSKNLTIPDYSAIFLNTMFWKSIPAEHVLVFQTDSMFLRPPRPGELENLLNHSYVGAPWCELFIKNPLSPGTPFPVGNGGFSLRRRSHSLGVIEDYWRRRDLVALELHKLPEDQFFCALFAFLPGYSLPSKEVAAEFGTESEYEGDPMSCHKPWFWLQKPDLERLGETHPDFKTLMKLNGGRQWNMPLFHDIGVLICCAILIVLLLVLLLK